MSPAILQFKIEMKISFTPQSKSLPKSRHQVQSSRAYLRRLNATEFENLSLSQNNDGGSGRAIGGVGRRRLRHRHGDRQRVRKTHRRLWLRLYIESHAQGHQCFGTTRESRNQK